MHEALSPQIAENVRAGISEIGITRSVVKNTDDFHIFPFCTEEIKNKPIATTDVIVPRISQAFETINCNSEVFGCSLAIYLIGTILYKYDGKIKYEYFELSIIFLLYFITTV